MASPQIENGHIKIANELWDALTAYRLPGEQRQCLDVIIRKTYGFNKKQDAIALSQFVEMTGIVKPHVVRAISALQEKKIITVTKKGNDPANVYEIIKDFSKWVPLPKKVTLPKKVMSVTKKGNPSLPKMVPTKDNTTKDTITKDNNPVFDYLVSQISEKGFDPYKTKLIEFYQYRMAKSKKDRYSTTKAIDGLFRECSKCLDVYCDLNECLDITMERGWKTPDPKYLEGTAKAKPGAIQTRPGRGSRIEANIAAAQEFIQRRRDNG